MTRASVVKKGVAIVFQVRCELPSTLSFLVTAQRYTNVEENKQIQRPEGLASFTLERSSSAVAVEVLVVVVMRLLPLTRTGLKSVR